MAQSERAGRGAIARGRPTPNVENYLKAVLKRSADDGWITPRALARYLGVSGASVTSMLKHLRRRGLADYAPYRGARLTPRGRAQALRVVRRHRLLERFLADVVGVPWDEVDGEAEALEHALSERLERRIDELLRHPHLDPHGDPIPPRRGTAPRMARTTLDEAHAGEAVVVRGVSDADPARLRYLARRGVVPEARLEVSRSGARAVEVRVGGRRRRISRPAARAVFVAPAETR